jgi:dTDP-4-dehydrorhamnose reductase
MGNIIITGASGLLGQYLCQHFSTRYHVIGFYNTSYVDAPNVEFAQVDLTDAFATEKIIKTYQPNFVIHTAGCTSVEECENNPKLAHLLNVQCTKNICDALNGLETKFIHISTDHLFSGEERNYTETHPLSPLNVYAQTKYLAELEALKLKKSVSIRTNFYGGHTEKKQSFSSWIFDELSKNHTIKMFDDVFFTPISIFSLAKNIELLMNSHLKGIYNLAGNERLSKYEFSLKLAKIFGLNSNLIIQSKIQQLHLKAKRPSDMSLSIAKIVKDLPSFEAESVNEGLQKIKDLNLI